MSAKNTSCVADKKRFHNVLLKIYEIFSPLVRGPRTGVGRESFWRTGICEGGPESQ